MSSTRVRGPAVAAGLALALLLSPGSARAQEFNPEPFVLTGWVIVGAVMSVPATSTLMFGSMDLSDAIKGKRMPAGLAATELAYGGLQAIGGGTMVALSIPEFIRQKRMGYGGNAGAWVCVGTAMLATGGWFVGHGIDGLRHPEHRLRRLPSVSPIFGSTKKGAVGGLSVLF
jgi:hypothetical protein